MEILRNCIVYTFYPENSCTIVAPSPRHTFPTCITSNAKRAFVAKRSVNKNFTTMKWIEPCYQHGSKMVYFDAMENKKKNLHLNDTTVFNDHRSEVQRTVESFLTEYKTKLEKDLVHQKAEKKAFNGILNKMSPW